MSQPIGPNHPFSRGEFLRKTPPGLQFAGPAQNQPLVVRGSPALQLLPKDVQEKLAEAATSGNYWVSICIGRGGSDDKIEVFQHRSAAFKEDWVTRCIKTLIGQLFAPAIPQAPAVQQHAPPQQSTLG